MSAALDDAGIVDLQAALRARQTTAVAVVTAQLARVRAHDGQLGAYMTVAEDTALAEARAADAALAAGTAGSLAGIPVAVKDLMAVRGVRRSNGSPAFAGDPPAGEDATVVARLRAAGAVVIGTTHLHELAFGPTGVNPEFGTPRNPWRPEHVPGGSSSGSGVAVAARLAAGALGTDTGGSVRIPASFCGITGLKPTYGRVSRHGVTPLAWTLDHVGPMARSVADVAELLQVLAGPDRRDSTAAPLPVPDYRAGLQRGLDGVRIGVLRRFGLASAAREVAAPVETALGRLEAAGAHLTDVDVPELEQAQAALGAVVFAEAESALSALLGPRLQNTGVEIQLLVQLARAVQARHYLAAQRFRTRLYRALGAVLSRVDLLALPATMVTAPEPHQLVLDVDGRGIGLPEVLARFTGPFNLSGHPALVVPCGFSPLGLPAALQLVGRPFGEAALLAAGHAFQQHTDWHRRRPPLPAA